MGQNEGRSMVRRIVAPPSLPSLVWPLPARRTKHVPSKYKCSEVVHRAMGEGIVHTFQTTPLAEHRLERPCSNKPTVEFRHALSQGVIQALVWASSKPVQRHSKSRYLDTSPLRLLYHCRLQAVDVRHYSTIS